MDRAHAEEASGWYRETSLVLEPSREREKTRDAGRETPGAHSAVDKIALFVLTLRTVLHNMLSSPQV